MHESKDEYFRVRPVDIFYYLEDDSIAVIEPHVENSGMPQGEIFSLDSNKIRVNIVTIYRNHSTIHIIILVYSTQNKNIANLIITSNFS